MGGRRASAVPSPTYPTAVPRAHLPALSRTGVVGRGAHGGGVGGGGAAAARRAGGGALRNRLRWGGAGEEGRAGAGAGAGPTPTGMSPSRGHASPSEGIAGRPPREGAPGEEGRGGEGGGDGGAPRPGDLSAMAPVQEGGQASGGGGGSARHALQRMEAAGGGGAWRWQGGTAGWGGGVDEVGGEGCRRGQRLSSGTVTANAPLPRRHVLPPSSSSTPCCARKNRKKKRPRSPGCVATRHTARRTRSQPQERVHRKAKGGGGRGGVRQ